LPTSSVGENTNPARAVGESTMEAPPVGDNTKERSPLFPDWMRQGEFFMCDVLERLSGVRIPTNVTTGDVEILNGFGLIDRYRIVREAREGRMQEIEVTLSDWVFNAINAHEVLTLNRNYFRLRKPLKRRVYEIVRKHCGSKDRWLISFEKFKKNAAPSPWTSNSTA
jgi:hypothetical protein